MDKTDKDSDYEYIKLTTLHEQLDELAGLYGSSGDVFFEIYTESFDRGPDYIKKRIGSTNSAFDNATDADKEEVMRLLAEIHTEPTTDAFYRDEKGRKKVNWETLIDDLTTEFTFRTIEDTEELLVYDNGTYRDGRTVVKRYVEEALSDVADLHAIREVTGHIQRRTYTPRDVVNADKRFIPVQNGLINLESLELEEFDSNKIYTFRVPVTFDPNAGFEHIAEFFNEVLEQEDVKTMQEIFGYALYPQQPAHKLFWWIGSGRNGKTTTSELLRAMIGAENDGGVPLAQLDGRHRFSVARLFGKLINVVAEPETKTPLQTPILKSASGGDLLHGELKGVQNVFPFWNFAKFIIFANDIPEIADTSFGFWQRALVIDFPHAFTGKDAIKNYHNVLIKKDGLAGLLNWALIGLNRLKENEWEFTETNTQDEAKLNMQRKAQPVKTFVDTWTDFDTEIEISKQIFYELFKQYCLIYRIALIEERDFTQQLQQYTNVRSSRIGTGEDRVRGWRGIRIKKDLYRLITRVGGNLVSADEALNAKVSDLTIKCIPLLSYMQIPTQPTQPIGLYLTCVGVKRVISENKDILSIQAKQVEKSGLNGLTGFEFLKALENEGNPKTSEEVADRLGDGTR